MELLCDTPTRLIMGIFRRASLDAVLSQVIGRHGDSIAAHEIQPLMGGGNTVGRRYYSITLSAFEHAADGIRDGLAAATGGERPFTDEEAEAIRANNPGFFGRVPVHQAEPGAAPGPAAG